MANVFFSYSHKDEPLRDELEVHLAMLKREGAISAWHDRKILAGDVLNGEIYARLNDAQVVLLLVSPDFLASAYCYDVEVERAMQLHEQGRARVIPVILRPCDWQTSAPLCEAACCTQRWEAHHQMARPGRSVARRGASIAGGAASTAPG